MRTKKVVKEKIDTFTDFKTGEVQKEISSMVVNIPVEPPYVKLYIDHICLLNNLPKGMTTAVLMELIKRVPYNGELNLTAYTKRKIAKSLGIKNIKSMDNIISNLIKKNIMDRIGTGTFLMNPNLFAKGCWSDIRKLRNQYLNLTISYQDNGYTMNSYFKPKPISDSLEDNKK